MKSISTILILLATLNISANDAISQNFDKSLMPFQYGESVKYTLKYGFIHGGNAFLSLNKNITDGKEFYHAKMLAKTSGLADRLFKVEDIYESVFEGQSCLPIKSVRNISEGKYKYYNETFFYHDKGYLVSTRKNDTVKIQPGIMDIVSSFFYLRKANIEKFKKGDIINFNTFFGDEVFPFTLKYNGKEIVTTKFGKILCYRFDPVVEVGRLFDSEDDMTFWVSADKNKIPVLIRLDMIVGSVKCELDEYTNLKSPLNILPAK